MAKEVGMTEKYDTEIKRVLDIFKDYGLPQPKFELIPGGFVVTVFSGIGQGDIKKADLKADDIDRLIISLLCNLQYCSFR